MDFFRFVGHNSPSRANYDRQKKKITILSQAMRSIAHHAQL